MTNKKEKLKKLGKNIQKARKKQRYTQKEIAKEIGISTPAYSRYENGKNEPGVLTAAQIASVCKTTVENLINEKKGEEP